MKRVNGAVIGLLLLQTAFSQETVPTVDAIQAAYDRSDLAQARELARRALNANPADPRVILLNSQIAIESDSPDYALTALRPLLSDPDYGPRARPWLGRALVMSNQPAAALQLLGDRAPTDGLSAAVSVVAHRALGELDRAREVFATGKAAFPNSPDLTMIEVVEALRVGDVGHARAQVQRLLHLAPNKVDTQMLAVRMALIDGQPDRAEKRLDWVLTVRPDHASALLAKGGLRQEKGDLAGAESFLKKAAKLSGNSALVAQYLRARMAYDQGDAAEARKRMDEIGNPSVFPPAAQLAGILAAEAGQNDRAIRLLQGYIAGNPDDATARGALAQALMQTGDAMEAWHYLEPAARSSTADAKIISLAAKLTAQLGLPEAKLWQARQQRAQMSQARLALFAQAQKAMSARDWQRADQIYAELLRGAPPAGDRILLNNAAYIRQQLGDLDGAERLIRRALALGTPDGVVLDTASWILFQKYGATPEVRSMSARAERLLPKNADVRAHAAKIRTATGEGPAA
jgi:predicted Zn-dependent protease